MATKTAQSPMKIGEDLKSFAPYSATSQFVGACVGSIVAYKYDLPTEISMAIAGLTGFVVNGIMVIAVKLLDKFPSQN